MIVSSKMHAASFINLLWFGDAAATEKMHWSFQSHFSLRTCARLIWTAPYSLGDVRIKIGCGHDKETLFFFHFKLRIGKGPQLKDIKVFTNYAS